MRKLNFITALLLAFSAALPASAANNGGDTSGSGENYTYERSSRCQTEGIYVACVPTIAGERDTGGSDANQSVRGTFCGDGICNGTETPTSCPSDCTGGGGGGQPGACGSAHGTTVSSYPTGLPACGRGSQRDFDSIANDGSYDWECATGQASDPTCFANRRLDGVCGAATGTTQSSMPSGSSACSRGTQTGTSTSTNTYSWTCAGLNGGASVNCSAGRLQSDACGTAHGTNVSFYPSGTAACASGSQSAVDSAANDGTFNWNCGSASCSAGRTVNGQCGSAAGVSTDGFPGGQTCSRGSEQATDVSAFDGDYNWECRGLSGGTNANCRAPRTGGPASPAACGTAAGVGRTTYPTGNLCSQGYDTTVDSSGADGSFDWTCTSVDGLQSVSCTAPNTTTPPVTGACGSANGVATSAYPSAGHCGRGTKVDVDTAANDGTFNWSCNGSNGGGNASCSASKTAAPPPTNGSCGTAQGSNTSTLPPGSQLCGTGSASVSDSTGDDGTFNWTCSGTNGGSTANCSSTRTAATTPGACGSANGTSVQTYPSSGHCSVGSASAVDTAANDGSFNWTCNSPDGGPSAACSASKAPPVVNGACGGANGSSSNNYPSSGHCQAGTVVDVDTAANDGSYNWSCNGAGGGSNATCSASKAAAATNGVCGTANNGTSSSFPTSGLCSAGTSSSTDTAGTDGNFNWTCVGTNGGSSASCQSTRTTGCRPWADIFTAGNKTYLYVEDMLDTNGNRHLGSMNCQGPGFSNPMNGQTGSCYDDQAITAFPQLAHPCITRVTQSGNMGDRFVTNLTHQRTGAVTGYVELVCQEEWDPYAYGAGVKQTYSVFSPGEPPPQGQFNSPVAFPQVAWCGGQYGTTTVPSTCGTNNALFGYTSYSSVPNKCTDSRAGVRASDTIGSDGNFNWTCWGWNGSQATQTSCSARAR